MAKDKASVKTLSIFLLKEGMRTPVQSLASPVDLKRAAIQIGQKKIGDLYFRQNPVRSPRWLKFFRGTFREATPRLYNANNAAVLLARSGTRNFALCFGQGRHLLAPGSWEENFGLRVTLNCVDPKRLRSVDRRSFDAYTSHTRTQTSIEGDVTAFGLNVEQDLLRAATGQPLDGALGRRMTGMDSLVVAVQTSPEALPDLLAQYLVQFDNQSYRQAFPWIDHIAEVREPQFRKSLDEEMLGVVVKTGASSPKAWLAVPTLIAWARIDGFTYSASRKAKRFPDLEIRDFLASLDAPASLTIEKLHQRSVYAIDVEDGNTLEKWPVYGCMYAEIEKGGATYLLTGGKWYRVERDFVKAVNGDVKRLVTSTALPRYKDKSETAYNKRIAGGSNGDLALLDRRLVRIGGTTVETCDLYSAHRQFIHVKRYGGSSVLSHLFAQGSVSGNAFAQDREFRRALNDLLPRSHKLTDPSERPDPSQFEIVYAVVSNSSDPIDRSLPFFSRLNLRNAARQLNGYGFKVSLTKIEA